MSLLRRIESSRVITSYSIHYTKLYEELALQNLESTWLFLARNDGSLVMDPSSPATAAALQMRIVEAQEAERSRLAQDRITSYNVCYTKLLRLEGYALSICSADFTDWVAKNTLVDSPYSYLYSNEYEMPEFNLGNTFNYAEMAALIAPRPDWR